MTQQNPLPLKTAGDPVSVDDWNNMITRINTTTASSVTVPVLNAATITFIWVAT